MPKQAFNENEPHFDFAAGHPVQLWKKENEDHAEPSGDTILARFFPN